jgi:DNA-binding transcriptional regulator YdaS (Cro superfamily)
MTNENAAREAIQEAIQIANGQTALARLVGGKTKQGHVYYWLKVGRVPPKQAQRIDKATGVSRKRLCPDFDWDDEGPKSVKASTCCKQKPKQPKTRH